jgi:hypothetical protein
MRRLIVGVSPFALKVSCGYSLGPQQQPPREAFRVITGPSNPELP